MTIWSTKLALIAPGKGSGDQCRAVEDEQEWRPK
jgi:hypothetical protein